MGHCYYLIIARVSASEEHDLIFRPPNTGWRPTHRLETGTKIESVSARFRVESVGRGIRIPAGQSAELEMCLWHSGDEPIFAGTRWLTERSNGSVTQNVVTQIIKCSVEFPGQDTTEDGFWIV